MAIGLVVTLAVVGHCQATTNLPSQECVCSDRDLETRSQLGVHLGPIGGAPYPLVGHRADGKIIVGYAEPGRAKYVFRALEADRFVSIGELAYVSATTQEGSVAHLSQTATNLQVVLLHWRAKPGAFQIDTYDIEGDTDMHLVLRDSRKVEIPRRQMKEPYVYALGPSLGRDLVLLGASAEGHHRFGPDPDSYTKNRVAMVRPSSEIAVSTLETPGKFAVYRTDYAYTDGRLHAAWVRGTVKRDGVGTFEVFCSRSDSENRWTAPAKVLSTPPNTPGWRTEVAVVAAKSRVFVVCAGGGAGISATETSNGVPLGEPVPLADHRAQFWSPWDTSLPHLTTATDELGEAYVAWAEDKRMALGSVRHHLVLRKLGNPANTTNWIVSEGDGLILFPALHFAQGAAHLVYLKEVGDRVTSVCYRRVEVPKN